MLIGNLPPFKIRSSELRQRSGIKLAAMKQHVWVLAQESFYPGMNLTYNASKN